MSRRGLRSTLMRYPGLWAKKPALGYDLTSASQTLNRELLRISDLSPGRYELTIDGQSVVTGTGAELGVRIQLLGPRE